MELTDWYPFIRRKGYDPVPPYISTITSLTTGRRRLDVLGTCFRVIRDAYSAKPQEAAHRILEKEIERFGTMANMTLYLDGAQAEEKTNTADVRETARVTPLERLEKSLVTFESRMETCLRIKKQHFADIKKGFASSFYWCLSSRQKFTEYMFERGWTVVVCNTEAGVAIAKDTKPEDVVILADSDWATPPFLLSGALSPKILSWCTAYQIFSRPLAFLAHSSLPWPSYLEMTTSGTSIRSARPQTSGLLNGSETY